MKPTFKADEYREHRDNYDGFCTTCNEFSAGEVEPDAENYECDVCGNNTVQGAENALIENLFDITDGE